MKRLVILCLSFLIAGLFASESCQNYQNYTPEQQWWNGLNDTWRIVFLRELNMLKKKPKQKDLERMWQLDHIACDHFPLGERNLEPLRKLKRLKTLSAGSTYISDISALAHLDSLVSVNFTNTPIHSIAPLAKHKHLECVYIQQTRVSSLEALKNKKDLQVVVFDQTPVTSILPILNLPNLSIVSMSDTKVPPHQLTEFLERQSNCDTYY